MNKLLFYIIFPFLHIAWLLNTSFAQINLVPNGSFEEHDTCPTDVAQITLAKHWYSPTLGSPDFFHYCSSSEDASIPINKFGFQHPKEGNGYAGFEPYVSWLDTNDDYLEYLQIKLINPLISGYTYILIFYISVGEISKYTIKNLGVLFSNQPITNNGWTIIGASPTYVFDYFVVDTVNWIELSMIYTAHGGENYLSFGNFSYSQYTEVLEISNQDTIGVTYYYIDDVKLFETVENTVIPNVFTPNNDGFNDYFMITFRGKTGHIMIYNRWGNKVFEQQAENKIEWDGTKINGSPCTEGTYFYVIYFSDNTKTTGSIQLLK